MKNIFLIAFIVFSSISQSISQTINNPESKTGTSTEAMTRNSPESKTSSPESKPTTSTEVKTSNSPESKPTTITEVKTLNNSEAKTGTSTEVKSLNNPDAKTSSAEANTASSLEVHTISTFVKKSSDCEVDFSFLNAKTDQGLLSVIYYQNCTNAPVIGTLTWKVSDGKDKLIKTDSAQIVIPITGGINNEFSFQVPLCCQDIFLISLHFHDITNHIQVNKSERFSTLADFLLPSGKPPVQKIPYIQENGFVNAPPNGLNLTGDLGRRIDKQLSFHLLHADIMRFFSAYLSKNGLNLAELEQAASFLENGSCLWRYHPESSLKMHLDRVAYALIHSIDSTGMMEAFGQPTVWNAELSRLNSAQVRGLMSYYEVFGYEPAYQAAHKMIFCMMSKPEIWSLEVDSLQNVATMTGGIINPLVDMYRFSGNSRELVLAKQLAAFYKPQQTQFNIDLALNDSSHIEKLSSALYDFAAMVKIYRITAEKEYMDFASKAWLKLSTDARFIALLEAKLTIDHQKQSKSLDDNSIEHVVKSWMLLTQQLFASKAEMVYYNELENLVYFSPAWNTACVTYIPEILIGTIDSRPVLLNYESGSFKQEISTSNGSTLLLSLNAECSLSKSGKVLLILNPEYPASFSVLLRVPSWAKNFKAVVGSREYSGEKNTLLNLQRFWNQGDKIEISFDLSINHSFGLYNIRKMAAPGLDLLEESIYANR